MKTAVLLAIIFLSWNLPVTYGQSAEKEINATINDMIQASLSKDLEKTLSYWDNSASFSYIADGEHFTYAQFKEMYQEFLASVESSEISESHVKVREIGKYKAICIWNGREKVTMKNQSPIESNWISTLVMENKKGGWVILHGHTSHF
ncbi:nuclear transport factor 2 family protein [Carboxylicivirga taeanensis]|uniref:nuclear transport factor 2 family protein n=1 Tax=Carboxylicivirga taeanensis TaxID=1416875 RepID=UPI003F6DFE2E